MTTSHLTEWLHVGVDAFCYVLATAAVAVVIAAVASSLAFSAFWSGVVLLLFLLGWFVFAYATVLGWPASKRQSRTPLGKVGELGSGLSSGDRREGLLEQQVAWLLPDSWTLAPSNRLTPAVKLFLSSFAILGISIGIELLIVR